MSSSQSVLVTMTVPRLLLFAFYSSATRRAALRSVQSLQSMGPREPPSQSQPTVRHLVSSELSSVSSAFGDAEVDDTITILGFGSLLSESSSRLTFPDLKDFRLCRVPNYRRVFAHPASIFFQRDIADLETLQMSSLSVEYEEGFPGFIASVFDVPNSDMMEDGIPSNAFLEREEEFAIIQAPFVVGGLDGSKNVVASATTQGIICTRSSDEAYIKRWGKDRFKEHYQKYGVNTIWGWGPSSGLRPCPVYLRHCYLSAKSMGPECFKSFLDETFLVDRATTIRQYVEEHPEVLLTEPPPELASRYSG